MCGRLGGRAGHDEGGLSRKTSRFVGGHINTSGAWQTLPCALGRSPRRSKRVGPLTAVEILCDDH